MNLYTGVLPGRPLASHAEPLLGELEEVQAAGRDLQAAPSLREKDDPELHLPTTEVIPTPPPRKVSEG